MTGDDRARLAADRIWLVLETLAAAHPGMPLSEGVPMAQRAFEQVDWARESGAHRTPDPLPDMPLEPDWRDPEAFGRWLAKKEQVTDLLPDKVINAIKEARMISGAGLKECKDAVEALKANWHWVLE